MANGFYDSKTRIMLDFHFPEWDSEILSEFDARKIVEKYEECSIDCFYFYAKDCYGHSYYNTKFGRKHRNLGDRDFLAEFVSEAKGRGYLVGVQYSINWQVNVDDNSFWAEDENGNYIRNEEHGVKRWPQICYNSKGYLQLCTSQIEEIVNNYDIDAIWFDALMYDFVKVACYCDKCRRAFKEEYGYDDLPVKHSWDRVWRDFLEFRFNANYKFANRLRDTVKKIKPEMVVIFNYHCGPKDNWMLGQKPVMHSSFSDFTIHEVYPAIFGIMYPSIVPIYLKGAQPKKPAIIFNTPYDHARCYGAIKSRVQYLYETMAAVAHGTSVTSVTQPFHTGELDESLYEMIGEVYGYIKSRKNLFKGEAIKFSCVYFSQKSRDLYGRENRENYSLPFNGAMKMLLEEHFPVDILFDENIDSIDFSKYKILVLPNITILDDIELEKIKEFANNGGVVIASDETSLYDVNGDILSNYMLSDLFGVDYVGKTKSSYNYFKAPKKYSSEIRDGYSVYVDGPANLIRTNNEYAEVYGDIEIPFYEANDAMFFYFQHPRWKSVGPCLVYNKYYEGKVFYFPFKLFRSYANKIALPEHRKFFRNIIEDLGIELPIEVHCPLNVDVVILEDGSDYYVHLTGYNPTRQVATGTSNPQEPFISPSLMMEEPLTYEAYIKINVPFIDYEIEGDSRVLEEKGNIVKIIVKDVYKSIKISKK